MPYYRNFVFKRRMDQEKNFLWAPRLWVRRRWEPILGYILKFDGIKVSGINGLKQNGMKSIQTSHDWINCNDVQGCAIIIMHLFLFERATFSLLWIRLMFYVCFIPFSHKFNKMSLKHQSYLKSWIIDAFERTI